MSHTSTPSQERCEMIRQSIESTTSDYDREKLQERLAKVRDIYRERE